MTKVAELAVGDVFSYDGEDFVLRQRKKVFVAWSLRKVVNTYHEHKEWCFEGDEVVTLKNIKHISFHSSRS